MTSHVLSSLVLALTASVATAACDAGNIERGAGGSIATAATGAGGSAKSGCAGVTLLPNPDDTSLVGTWEVGAKTVHIANLTAEVWYPAMGGRQME